MGEDIMAEIGTTLAAAAVKSATGPASNALIRWGIKKYDKFIVSYTNALSEYIEDNIKQCGFVKNILYRNQLASTDEKYVQVFFTGLDDKKISDETVVSALLDQRKILIRGRAGAGKTMFTKWAVLRVRLRMFRDERFCAA
jgi:predicted ATPase with chaperone activity